MLTLQLTQKYIIFKHFWSLVGVLQEADAKKGLHTQGSLLRKMPVRENEEVTQ